MSLRMWAYFLRQSLRNIRNNRLIHFIGVSTMLISLLIFGSFLLLLVNVNNWIQGWGQSWYMSVYLQDGISEEAKNRIHSYLEGVPSVEIERYISKDTAFLEFKKALGSQAELLDGLSTNPLPASFEVVLKGLGKKKTDFLGIKKALEGMKGVEEVQYSEEWLRRFEGLMNVVRLGGFIVGGLLCVAVLFIVTNTIKLTIYSRRDEIEILKLVGATDWFVKAPFLLEGLLQGTVSGMLAPLGLFWGYLLLSAKKIHVFGLALLDLVFIPKEYVIGIFLLSVFLALMGSLIAVGRFFEL